jgi:hypothetical protein
LIKIFAIFANLGQKWRFSKVLNFNLLLPPGSGFVSKRKRLIQQVQSDQLVTHDIANTSPWKYGPKGQLLR